MKRHSAIFGLALTLAMSVSSGQTADPKAGEKAFKRCAACHTVDKGGKKKAGPNLYGIVGAPVAAVEGFKYSKALEAYGGVWSPARLDAFLKKPKKEVKGTRMGYPGMKKDAQRADLIAYLNSKSDAPIDLDPAADKQADAAPTDAESEFGVLVAGKGAEETYNYCIACHSEMIVAQQGLTKPQWLEMMDWMVEEQGMDEIEEPEFSLIVDYLAENYGPERPNFPKK